MMKKRLLVLCLIMAFALTGVAYAAWTDTLVINGSVGTGKLNLIFTGATVTDNEQGRDVASTTASIGTDEKTLDIAITNAYPGYQAIVKYTIQNEGTVPVKLKAITPNVPAVLTVNNTAAAGITLAPGESREYTLTHLVGDSALENQTYTYKVQLDFTQFTP